MIEVSATDFVKNFGQYKERAQREVIAITSHGRTSGYFLSEHEYREYMLLKSQARQAYHISELPEAIIQAMASAEMNPEHDHLDQLMV
jgi:PHD/YefM family antitoxin component YafN of YafNO toxin-antitoxin module